MNLLHLILIIHPPTGNLSFDLKQSNASSQVRHQSSLERVLPIRDDRSPGLGKPPSRPASPGDALKVNAQYAGSVIVHARVHVLHESLSLWKLMVCAQQYNYVQPNVSMRYCTRPDLTGVDKLGSRVMRSLPLVGVDVDPRTLSLGTVSNVGAL